MAVETGLLDIGDGLSAAERIEQIAPFLECFNPASSWRVNANSSYPLDFVPAKNYPLLNQEDAKRRLLR